MTMNDAAKVGKKNMSKNATAELILQKSGQTARLTEIKMKTAYAKKEPDSKKTKRSYSAEMKKLYFFLFPFAFHPFFYPLFYFISENKDCNPILQYR